MSDWLRADNFEWLEGKRDYQKHEPIATEYDGLRFRSRLEARWAYLFNHLGIKYLYEPMPFDLGGLHYLPDFYFPKRGQWAEVKPNPPSETEMEKAKRLTAVTGESCWLLISLPVMEQYGCWVPGAVEPTLLFDWLVPPSDLYKDATIYARRQRFEERNR